MLKRNLAVVLCALLLTPLFGLQAKAQSVNDAALRAEQAKIKVAKIGTGQTARVEVKMRDNTKLKGYISEAGSDSFTLTDRKTGASQTVAYTDVIKRPETGWRAFLAYEMDYYGRSPDSRGHRPLHRPWSVLRRPMLRKSGPETCRPMFHGQTADWGLLRRNFLGIVRFN